MDQHGVNARPSGRPEGKTVGDAARAVGVGEHVLRHWEDEGVLVPSRDALGHRRYSDGDLALAAGVRRAQRAGLSLAQIRAFLAAGASDRRALLTQHRTDLLERMRALGDAAGDVGERLAEPPDPACPYGV